MKKIIFALITVISLLLTVPCVAEKMEGTGMVYASGIELESTFEALTQEDLSSSSDVAKLLKYDDLSIVKESITPVYTINMLDYSKTNELVITPMYAGKNMDKRVYSSKMIDGNNAFSGSMTFYVDDGIAYRLYSSPQPFKEYEYQYASTSYADHAKRIQKILKLDSLVSPVDVKYVVIDGVGDFFCVKSQDRMHFIAVGIMPVALEHTDKFPIDYALDDVGLKQIADQQLEKYNAHLAEVEKWEKEHPGEEWTATGSSDGQTIVSQCSEVDNVLDIAEYLNIDFTVNWDSGKIINVAVNLAENKTNDYNKTTNLFTKIAITCSICLAIGVLIFVALSCFRSKIAKRDLR